MAKLKKQDSQIAKLIDLETERQKTSLEMIPSENHSSPAVREALGSILTDKYAEGYPGKRYYAGLKYYDVLEDLCRDRANKFFKSVQYGVDEKTHLLNYSEIEKLAKENKPKLIFVGATAYPRIFDWKKLGEIADSVGAYLVADIAHIAGLVAGGAHPSPVPYVHIISTTTHKTLRGPRGGMIMV